MIVRRDRDVSLAMLTESYTIMRGTSRPSGLTACWGLCDYSGGSDLEGQPLGVTARVCVRVFAYAEVIALQGLLLNCTAYSFHFCEKT